MSKTNLLYVCYKKWQLVERFVRTYTDINHNPRLSTDARQCFLKHAIPKYLINEADLFSFGLSNNNNSHPMRTSWIKYDIFFRRISLIN